MRRQRIPSNFIAYLWRCFRTIRSMFVFLLQAAHHAAKHVVGQPPATMAQAPPQIYVTVQQPPGGMPEWLKILITAGVGALVGICSNIAMEYVKPWVAKRVLKKTVTKQIHDELLKALAAAHSAYRILNSAADKSEDEKRVAAGYAELIGSGVETDRFDFYFADQKALMYELDESNSIKTFYRAVKQGSEAARSLAFDRAKNLFYVATNLMEPYIRFHKLTYAPEPNPVEEVFDQGGKVPIPPPQTDISSPS
jgi:hypothetical protein